MRIKIVFLFLILLPLFFQNCVNSVPVKFFNNRTSLKSELGGGPYEGKPETGYYCRIFDDMPCQSQVQNLQSLVKVDNLGIHLLQDNCASKSVNFQDGDSAVDFSSLASNYLGVSRGIFKKCEVGSDNLPLPSNEMTEVYCVSDQDNMTVVLNKDLNQNDLSFDLFFKNNSQPHEVRGGSVIKSTTSLGNNYSSVSQEFNLDISSSNSQTAQGHLQVVIDDKPLSVDLNCRIASPIPTVVINDDLEISPTWIDTTNLVGYWKLNEVNAANGSVILDSSRYAAHGTLLTDNGNLVKSDSSTAGRSSLFFDGVNDTVNIPRPADGHLDFGMRSFTYMVWIKKSGRAGSWDMPFFHGGSNTNVPGFDIECGGGCGANISDGLSQTTSIQHAKFADSGNSLIGRWALLTAVVDRDLKQLRTYVDGNLVTTKDISALGSIIPNNNLYFGSNNVPTYFFWGLIDDVSIWSKALTENEIKEIFQRLRPKFN